MHQAQRQQRQLRAAAASHAARRRTPRAPLARGKRSHFFTTGSGLSPRSVGQNSHALAAQNSGRKAKPARKSVGRRVGGWRGRVSWVQAVAAAARRIVQGTHAPGQQAQHSNSACTAGQGPACKATHIVWLVSELVPPPAARRPRSLRPGQHPWLPERTLSARRAAPRPAGGHRPLLQYERTSRATERRCHRFLKCAPTPSLAHRNGRATVRTAPLHLFDPSSLIWDLTRVEKTEERNLDKKQQHTNGCHGCKCVYSKSACCNPNGKAICTLCTFLSSLISTSVFLVPHTPRCAPHKAVAELPGVLAVENACRRHQQLYC